MTTEEIKSNILTNFKTLNSITGTAKDNIYNLYIDKSMQTILNLTNRIEFPEELQYVVLDMLTDFYNINVLKDSIGEETSNYVKSISEEGRSVTFGNSSELSLSSLINTDINNRLELRKQEIYRYKLLYKVTPKKETNQGDENGD